MERSVTINKPPADIYSFWRGFENLPRFMRHLEAVTTTGPSRSHWVAKAPLGKAVVAVAHSILSIIYHMLTHGVVYADLGPDYFDTLDATRLERHHVRRLEQLGYTVTLTPKEAT